MYHGSKIPRLNYILKQFALQAIEQECYTAFGKNTYIFLKLMLFDTLANQFDMDDAHDRLSYSKMVQQVLPKTDGESYTMMVIAKTSELLEIKF